MPPDALAADNGLLTTEQAIADLTAAETEHEDAAPAQSEQPSQPNTEAEPAAEDAIEPETVTDDADAETEDAEAEGEKPELPAIEPPRFWDAEAKKRFGELPRDIQELLSQNEDRSVKATSKSLQEAAEARNAAAQEASNLSALRTQLDQHIQTAKARFKSKWENVDWNATIDQYGADQALKFKNEFEADQAAIAQAERGAAVAEQTDLKNFTAREMAKLPELAPDLVDPKTGPQRLEAMSKVLQSAGYAPAQIQRLSAFEVSLLNDALKWREANANAKAQIGLPKTAAKPAVVPKPSVRPTAAPARGSTETSRLKALETRFDQNPSVENLEALLKAQGT